MSSAKVSSKLAKAALGIMLATLLTKFLGFFKEIFVANAFGASSQADAYFIALVIPAIIFASVVEAIKTSFIPVYSTIKVEQGDEKGIQFTNNVLNILLLFSIALTIVGEILIEPIVSVIAVGFDSQTFQLAVTLTRITFPMIIFIGIGNVFTGYLQSNDDFVVSNLINIPSHIMMIIALSMSTVLGIKGVIVVYLIGSVFQVIIQAPSTFKKGYRYQWRLDFKDDKIRHMGNLIMPVLIGTAVQQFNTLIDRMLASGLEQGSVAALTYANRLNAFVFGIVSLSIATVIYPVLSEYNAVNDKERFKKMITYSVNSITVLVLPIVVGTMALGVPIIKLLFQRGQFDTRATLMTAGVLFFYAIGMLFFGYRDILNKIFYSLHDTKIPMINGGITLGLNIVINIVLSKIMGLNGLALGTSLSALITTILLFYNLHKKISGIAGKDILTVAVKSLLASAVMGLVCYYSYQGLTLLIPQDAFIYQTLRLGSSVLVGVVVYFVGIYMLRVEEFNWCLNIVLNKIKKS